MGCEVAFLASVESKALVLGSSRYWSRLHNMSAIAEAAVTGIRTMIMI